MKWVNQKLFNHLGWEREGEADNSWLVIFLRSPQLMAHNNFINVSDLGESFIIGKVFAEIEFQGELERVATGCCH